MDYSHLKNSPEHLAKITAEREPRAYYLEIKNQYAHKRRHPHFNWMNDGFADAIGEHDVKHEQILIPYIDVDYDPFLPFEGDWDLDTIDDYTKLANVNVWNRVNPKHRPIVGFLLKHQNPNVGLLDAKGILKPKRHHLFTPDIVTKKMVENLKTLEWDISKLWRIYGYAVPFGEKSMKDYYKDTCQRYCFNLDFGFGVRYSRTFYTLYDNVEGKYIKPNVRRDRGYSYSDKPTFATHTVMKMAQMLHKRGLPIDYIDDNLTVVRYHFFPLKSFQVNIEMNGVRMREAEAMYNAGNEDIVKYNYHAFRYHHKKMAKLRKKV